MISPLAAANVTLSTATIGAFTGFRVANINEAQSVQQKSLANSLGYPELYDVAFGFGMHTSTPTTVGTNHAVSTYYGTTNESNSLSNLRCMVVKTINISDL